MLGGQLAVACNPQSALAGLNSRPRELAPGSVRRPEVLMVRSHAMSACEPGQDREVAALSDTAHAPWGSRIGAKDRRARPEPSFKDGCTVRFQRLNLVDDPLALLTVLLLGEEPLST